MWGVGYDAPGPHPQGVLYQSDHPLNNLATNYKVLYPLIVHRGPNCVYPPHCYQHKVRGLEDPGHRDTRTPGHRDTRTPGSGGTSGAAGHSGTQRDTAGHSGTLPQIRGFLMEDKRESFANRLPIRNIKIYRCRYTGQ